MCQLLAMISSGDHGWLLMRPTLTLSFQSVMALCVTNLCALLVHDLGIDTYFETGKWSLDSIFMGRLRAGDDHSGG